MMPGVPPLHQDSEEDSLLPRPNSSQMRHRTSWFLRANISWNAHPFWLIPVVLVMSMSRGVTMSPRIQVYKAIACRALSVDAPDTSNLMLFSDCGARDADVQARAAKVQAAVVTTMSVLSAISTGFWSRLGDTHGRKLILSSFLIGALAMECVFVLVMTPNTLFGRYAEHFILVGPVIEGFVGGLSTFNGVVHAYISDCTRHGSRSNIFSTVQGMVFAGLAIGPWLGGLFLPPIGYNDGFFFISISLIALTLLYVIFLCPESKETSIAPPASHEGNLRFKTSPVLVVRHLIVKFASAVLLPVSMFAPRLVPGNPSRKNFNMTLIGLGFFLYIVSTGVYTTKYLYAQHVYTWTTAQLGYYMSILWVARAFNLLVFLPILLSYFKPKSTSSPGSNPNAHDIAAEMKFDRYLAQISLGVDGIADTLVAITSNKSQATFVALSCLSSFASGGNPALHSLGAVCLHACGYSSEVGALFGAMGVLSAAGHIISPYIYAMIYGSTVAYFPEAIFVLAACLLYTVVFFLGQMSSREDDIALVHTSRMGAAPEEHATPSTSRDFAYQAVPLSDEEGSRK